MTKLHTQNAPDVRVVKPHFILGGWFFALAVLLMFLAHEKFFGPYFDTKIVSIVHADLIGWAMLIVYGSLYQLIPVVFETKLFSETLAKITLALTMVGLVLMLYGFWYSAFDAWFLTGVSLVYTALFLFVFNIGMSYRHSRLKNIKSYFIVAAVFWLFITQTEGILMAFNFRYPVLEAGNLYHLKIHAFAGLIGFFLQMIFGVGTTLLPMFLVSHKHSEKPLWPAFILINTGLLLFVLQAWFMGSSRVVNFVAYLLIVGGILSYVKFVRDAYVNRFKRKLDEGMQPSMLIFIVIFLPVLLAFLLLLIKNPLSALALRISMLFGFFMIFGVINMIILGQTYKTIPFIIWLDTYKPFVGKYQIPLPKQVYNEKLALWQFRIYVLYLILFATGLLMQCDLLLKIALILLALTAFIYNFNLIKMYSHKPILKPLPEKK